MVRSGRRPPARSALASSTTDGPAYASTTTRVRWSGWPEPRPATPRSNTRSTLIADVCGKVAAMHALLQLLAVEDAATEGKKVITGMLITGLVFVGVIAVGQTLHWVRHRRR